MFDYSIIQNLLKERNLEAKDLAENIGVYPPRLSDWKSGRLKFPSIDNLEKIADYFNVSVDYLLGKPDAPHDSLNVPKKISDDDIKFALYGTVDEVTDKKFEEVKRLIRLQEERK
ncbi:MAG: helix-turn-helix domain-containing protein [Spirochaetia bacterium]|jgi:transcriptional regulator with XRE-family HTH domain|nr:helix-turn-helix domain-containing protein [Spirochaetia bacterium]